MEDHSLISIIVPIYNVECYLEKCLESIANQSYKNLEVLLVNDGSTDNSIRICEKFVKTDKRFNLINKANGGLASARNAGMKMANGEYIACVDSDDWIEPQMIEKLFHAIVETDSDMAACSYYIEDSGKTTIKKGTTNKEEVLDRNSGMLYALLPHKYYGFAWNKMYRKSLLEDMTFDEKIKKGEDSPFSCEYILKCDKIIYLNYPLYHYRQDTISISRSRFNVGKLSVLDAYDYIVKLLLANGFSNDLVLIQKTQYANQLLSLLVNIIKTNYKKYKQEFKFVRDQMWLYRKIYKASQYIDNEHKLAYSLALYCCPLFKIFCKIKGKRV